MSSAPDAVPRAPVTLDFGTQVRLAGVLSAVHEYQHLLDDGFYRGAAGTIATLAGRFEHSTDTRMSLSGHELVVLGVVVEAAWRFTNTFASTLPFTMLNRVAGMEDAHFFAVVQWLDAVQGAHFPEDHPPAAPAATPAGLGYARCVQLLEVLAYVKEVHGDIDPLMYDVQESHFDAITNLLARAARRSDVAMTIEERYALETVVLAASAYSYRRSGRGLKRVKDAEFKALVAWLGAARQA